MKLFVYGTLKRGHKNHGLLNLAHFIGNDAIRADLYSNGLYPIITEGDGTVYGEVYEVDANSMVYIRALEASYEEKEIKTLSGRTVSAYFAPAWLKTYGDFTEKLENGIFPMPQQVNGEEVIL